MDVTLILSNSHFSALFHLRIGNWSIDVHSHHQDFVIIIDFIRIMPFVFILFNIANFSQLLNNISIPHIVPLPASSFTNMSQSFLFSHPQ